MPGRYRGFKLGDKADAGDGRYIRFVAVGAPGEVIIDAPSSADPNWMILLETAHHVIVQGFNLAGTNTPGSKDLHGPNAGILINGDFVQSSKLCHHIAVVGNYSHEHKAWGIHSVDSHTVLIEDNLFASSGREHSAYFSDGSDDYVIRRNVFFGSNASGLQVNVDPLASLEKLARHPALDYPPMAPTREWALGLLKLATDRFGANAFPDGRGFNYIIEANVINGNGRGGGAAINLAGVRESLIQNNLVYGNYSSGIAEWDNGNPFDAASVKPGPQSVAEVTGADVLPIFGCFNNLVRNNTVLMSVRSRPALLVGNGSWGTRAFNNVLVNDELPSNRALEHQHLALRRQPQRPRSRQLRGPGGGAEEPRHLPPRRPTLDGGHQPADPRHQLRPPDRGAVGRPRGQLVEAQPEAAGLPPARGVRAARRPRRSARRAPHRSRGQAPDEGRHRRLRGGAVKTARGPLVELALGAAWLVGIGAAVQLLDQILGVANLGAAIFGALLVDLAAGRAGVRWDRDDEGIDAGKSGPRRIAIGAAIALGAGGLVLLIATALRWFHGEGGVRPSSALALAVGRAAAVSVRDEMLFRGVPLLAARRAGVPAPVARGFAALVSGAAIVMIPGVSVAAVALAVSSGWLFATLWERDRGAWAAVGAHGAWVLLIGSVLHGGLFDVEWTTGNLAIGASASGGPAWLSAGVLVAAAFAVRRAPV